MANINTIYWAVKDKNGELRSRSSSTLNGLHSSKKRAEGHLKQIIESADRMSRMYPVHDRIQEEKLLAHSCKIVSVKLFEITEEDI